MIFLPSTASALLCDAGKDYYGATDEITAKFSSMQDVFVKVFQTIMNVEQAL